MNSFFFLKGFPAWPSTSFNPQHKYHKWSNPLASGFALKLEVENETLEEEILTFTIIGKLRGCATHGETWSMQGCAFPMNEIWVVSSYVQGKQTSKACTLQN